MLSICHWFNVQVKKKISKSRTFCTPTLKFIFQPDRDEVLWDQSKLFTAIAWLNIRMQRITGN